MDLKGKVALVTGGSRGIGRAICVALAASGASRISFTYRDAAGAEETKAMVLAQGASCLALEAEMRDRPRVVEVVRSAVGETGSLDILVHNAGTTGPGPLKDLSDDEWDRVVDVNLGSAFRYCRAAAAVMADGGAILFIGTTAALQGTGPIHYVASKSGLLGLSRCLARELSPRKIRVNTLLPGFVDTDFHGQSPVRDIVRHQVSALVPLRRMAAPEEVAAMAVSVLENPYVTGASLAVAGGAVMT